MQQVHASPPLLRRVVMPATRAAVLALSALRTCSSHKRFKPQLARVILLRKDFDQLKRVGFVVKRKVQHSRRPSKRSYAKPGHKLAIVCSVR